MTTGRQVAPVIARTTQCCLGYQVASSVHYLASATWSTFLFTVIFFIYMMPQCCNTGVVVYIVYVSLYLVYVECHVDWRYLYACLFTGVC